jgi:hypothetical protein
MDYYVYYRVHCEQVQSLLPKIRQMQAALSQCGKVTAALKRRPGQQDDCQTWMEVYLTVPDNFDVLLEQALLTAGIPALMAGERHLERFMDLSEDTLCA